MNARFVGYRPGGLRAAPSRQRAHLDPQAPPRVQTLRERTTRLLDAGRATKYGADAAVGVALDGRARF